MIFALGLLVGLPMGAESGNKLHGILSSPSSVSVIQGFLVNTLRIRDSSLRDQSFEVVKFFRVASSFSASLIAEFEVL
jgi:hypothetical protein